LKLTFLSKLISRSESWVFFIWNYLCEIFSFYFFCLF